jgi:hypothetical protein
LTRSLGAIGVVVGAVLIGFNPNRWDLILVTLPRGHGIHVRDVVGMLLIGAGIAMLWKAPARR